MPNTHPKLTIGLPVYNGEDFLQGCLNVLTAQTYCNFQLLIFDNASTDRTPEIAQDAARNDQRILYHRNELNLGGSQNFLDVLAASDTEYFAWRADDDLSSNDYFERLITALEHSPNAVLAASHVESRNLRKLETRHTCYIRDWPIPRVLNILRKMFRAHQSWLYGVWRTERLREYYLSSWEEYPIPWANDHLVLFNVILDEALTGDEQTVFIQQTNMRSEGNNTSPVKPIYSEIISFRNETLPIFLRTCRNAMRRRKWNFLERIILNSLIGIYARKRVRASRKKTTLLKLRRMISG